MDDDKAQGTQEDTTQDPVDRLMTVANALAAMANSDGQDVAQLKLQIAEMVTNLRAATKTIVAERHEIKRNMLQQSLANADSYEHERRRIEPRKPANDPHRVDWKPGMGF
jgi:hypothetical protein